MALTGPLCWLLSHMWKVLIFSGLEQGSFFIILFSDFVSFAVMFICVGTYFLVLLT